MCFSSLFLACSATSIRLLVTPAKADTTTAILQSLFACWVTMSLTWRMFSPVATLLPPNFMTIFIFRTPSFHIAFCLLTCALYLRGLLKLHWQSPCRLHLCQ